MTIVRYIKPLAVFFFLLAYAMLGAQGWENTYGGITSDVANDLIQTADNGWLMVGSSSSFGVGDQDVYLVKTDVDGTEQWHRSFGSANIDNGSAIDLLSDGTILIAGNSESATGSTHGMIWKRNALGDSLWSFKTPQDSTSLIDIAQTPDGNIVAVGSKMINTIESRIFIVKIDENGQLIAEKTLEANDIEKAFELLVISDTSFLIAGYSHDDPNSGSIDAYLAKINSALSVEWEAYYGDSLNEEQALSITHSLNGGYYLGGFSDDGNIADEAMWLLEVDVNGTYIFDTIIQIEGQERCRAITQLADSTLLLAGEINGVNDNVNGILVKTSSTGNTFWSKSYGGLNTDVLTSIELFNDNIFLSGTTASFGAGGFDTWFLRTDLNGNSLTHVLNGNIYDDLNFNCLPSTNELGIEDWLVKIVGPKTFYASTDTNGYYEASVEQGDYTVSLITPNPYWEPCTNDFSISFAVGIDTIQVDFPVQRISTCPFMTVDISTPFLRRCFQNTYVVKYCNSGTDTATNSVINIELDDFLTIDSSEVTLTSVAGTNQFEFTVGTLAPFECGSFRVYTTVDCNTTVLGQTHCNIAKITPDTFCVAPDPSWDGSSLELNGFCNGDSVFINVTNTGPLAMTDASAFIIIEDHLLTRQVPIKLGGNQDTTIVIEAQGQTIRAEVEQSTGHPGNSQPAIAIEGCNGNPFSLGFVTQYPQDDGDNFVEIDCQENIGAYDPNDKRGYPKGYGTEKYIENDTELEYLIRFQNTGTDTAFTVVIRDTLRTELNPSTIKPGTSSHPYDFEIYENGVIRFTFDQILLVDSFTNEPGSHGFVKFKITPTPDLNPNTSIHNSADIYFDFNPPVITNQTTHIVGANFIQIDTTSSIFNPNLPQVAITIVPNPFSQKTRIELNGSNSINHQIQVFNALGRLVKTEKFIGNKLFFDKENLPEGVYFFNIKNDQNQLISTGKMMLQ